jgi:hypothetical protein
MLLLIAVIVEVMGNAGCQPAHCLHAQARLGALSSGWLHAFAPCASRRNTAEGGAGDWAA